MHNARGNDNTSSARCRRRIQKAPDSTVIPRLKNNPSTQGPKKYRKSMDAAQGALESWSI
ncbi:hypothetical protein I7I48_07636 [Histoplasma ohiense]|nr:hypothetical protein I7I48_07636 [Histoplasma ohiense (nom. inval.)]